MRTIKPRVYKPEIGWCRNTDSKHEGMHQRTAECVDYRYPRETGTTQTRNPFDFRHPVSQEDRERFERIRNGEK